MSETKENSQVVKKKKKWIVPVIIGGILAILAAVIVSVVLSASTPKKKLQKQLDLGEKYLAELDYDNAILAYEEAIKIDPKMGDAYLGLADAHIGKNDIESAKRVLQEGYDASGDERLLDKLRELEELEIAEKKTEEETPQTDIENLTLEDFEGLYEEISIIATTDIWATWTPFVYYNTDETREHIYDDVIEWLELYIAYYTANKSAPEKLSSYEIDYSGAFGTVTDDVTYPSIVSSYVYLGLAYIKSGNMEKASETRKAFAEYMGQESIWTDNYRIDGEGTWEGKYWVYDHFGRLIENYDGNTVKKYVYEGNRIVEVRHSGESNTTIRCTYDESGRVIRIDGLKTLYSNGQTGKDEIHESYSIFDYSVPGELYIGSYMTDFEYSIDIYDHQYMERRTLDEYGNAVVVY